MRIKKLFKTESEYLDFAWSFIDFDENKIWRSEDYKIMKPFFDFDAVRYKLSKEEYKEQWTPEVDAGFLHWEKCRKDYADALFEIRDSIRGFQVEELIEFFLLEPVKMVCYDVDEDGNEIDEDGNIIPPLSRETIKLSEEWRDEMTFPLMFVGWIDSSWDRYGDARMCFSEFVSLKEFS